MNIRKDDTIVTAYAERASGPGWANCPLWVVVRGRDGVVRVECLQPEEQTNDMVVLYNVSEAVHLAMTQAVKLRKAVKTAPKP